MAVKKKAAAKKAAVKKSTAKAAPKRKAATRKTTVKKAAVKKAPKAAVRPKSIGKKQTKTQVIQAISDNTGLNKKQVADVFANLGELIQRHMQRRGSGEFTIPDTGVKIRRIKKPARKARMGRNPATGESIKIAAKPATTVIKVAALKALKDTLG